MNVSNLPELENQFCQKLEEQLNEPPDTQEPDQYWLDLRAIIYQIGAMDL